MLLFLVAPLSAQTPAPVAPVAEVTVTAPRGLTIGGVEPIRELSASELESYGVDTLSDLVDALAPLTRSGRSAQAPVVLINGRLAGQGEFVSLPSDAIERVEVLPELVALGYGFSENQRVLNFVLRAHYRAIPTRVSESGATEGGARATAVDASLARLEDDARVTMLGSFQNNSRLLESDRGIDLPESIDRTLQPGKSEGKVVATVSGLILGMSSSLEGSFDRASTKGSQGAVNVADAPISLLQSTDANTARLALRVTGQVGRFFWGATGSYMRLTTNSLDALGL